MATSPRLPSLRVPVSRVCRNGAISVPKLGSPARRDEAKAVVLLYAAFLGPDKTCATTAPCRSAFIWKGALPNLTYGPTIFLAGVLGDDEAARVAARAKAYLLVERNLTFVRNARPLLAEGGAVIAVGAGHLPGPTAWCACCATKG